MLNSVLFASDEVIKVMADFVKNPNYNSFIKTASAMRKDLWGKDTKIRDDVLRTIAFVKLHKVAKEKLTENRKQKTENGL